MISGMTSRPELCVGAIARHDGNLLMIRRGHGPAAGEWSIPGGRVERGEMLVEAVVRELREETGLEGACGELIGWTELIDDELGTHFVVLDFQVTVLDDVSPVAADDAIEAQWVPLDQVVDRRLADGLAEFLHEHGIVDVIT
jgi:8-oxo-dGTP diphosphatase